jgi:putative membrane protein
MQIPGIYAEQIDRVCNSYFPENKKQEYSTHPVSARLMIRTFSYFSIIIIVFGLITYFKIIDGFNWSIVVFTFFLGIIYTYFSWKKWKVQISPKGLLLRRGFIRTSYLLLRWEKIQGLRSRQSIFQHYRSLSDLHIFTAAGVVKIPYLEAQLIKDLRDYLLYYVESDDTAWM